MIGIDWTGNGNEMDVLTPQTDLAIPRSLVYTNRYVLLRAFAVKLNHQGTKGTKLSPTPFRR